MWVFCCSIVFFSRGLDYLIKSLIWDDWCFLEVGDIFFLWGFVGGILFWFVYVLILLYFVVLWYCFLKFWFIFIYVGSYYVEEFYFCSKIIYFGILIIEE